METPSTLLALCEGNPPVTCGKFWFLLLKYTLNWNESEYTELINSDQFRLSILIQFQFKISQFNFKSIMLNWTKLITMIINSNSIHELIRAQSSNTHRVLMGFLHYALCYVWSTRASVSHLENSNHISATWPQQACNPWETAKAIYEPMFRQWPQWNIDPRPELIKTKAFPVFHQTCMAPQWQHS